MLVSNFGFFREAIFTTRSQNMQTKEKDDVIIFQVITFFFVTQKKTIWLFPNILLSITQLKNDYNFQFQVINSNVTK